MATGKNSFVLYIDLIHTVKKLSDEKAGQLFKHVLEYVNDKDPITKDEIIDIVFEPIKQSLKRDLKKYEKTCERNRKNGLKGGRPKNKPTGLGKKRVGAKKADSDSDSDSDSDTVNEGKSKSVRKLTFTQKVRKAIKKHDIDLDEDDVAAFFDKWCASNEGGKKLAFEMEKVFDIPARLRTWARNAKKWGGNSGKDSIPDTPDEGWLSKQDTETVQKAWKKWNESGWKSTRNGRVTKWEKKDGDTTKYSV